jgi:hypothetical protein
MKKFLEYSGYIIGFVGFALSIYFYEISKKEKDPTFVVEPVRTEIINSSKLQNSPIRVIKSDSQEIKRDLTSIRFYFWNKGKEAIKKENILSDIIIQTEPSTKIIHNRILKQARDISHISLNQIDSNKLKLDFKILENEDGFTGEILLEGNPNSKIAIRGAVEGVKSFSNFPTSFYKVISKTLLYFILGVIALGFTILTTGSRSSFDPDHVVWKADPKYNEDENFKTKVEELERKFSEFTALRDEVGRMKNPKKNEKTEEEKLKSKKRLNTILIIAGAIIIIGALIFTWYKVNEEIEENPSNFIPTSIKP